MNGFIFLTKFNKRRLKMLSIDWNEVFMQASILYFTILWFGPFCLMFIYPFILLNYPWLLFVAIPYCCWIYYDTKIAFQGGRKNLWFSKFIVYRYVRRYFSAKLIKTVDIPADRNYLFVLYPHAILAGSAVANFLVNEENLNELFPGISFRFVTLNANIYMPIVREHILPLGNDFVFNFLICWREGACSSSEISIFNLLNSKPAKGALLLPGGATEAATLRPGKKCEIIQRRKGFIRLALKTGTSLVPVFGFGENHIYDHVIFENPWIIKIVNAFQRYTGFCFVVPRGCYNSGKLFNFLPARVPLTTVVGEPINVPKIENPSQELINEYHEKFFSALVNLFEKYKEIYDVNGKDSELVFL